MNYACAFSQSETDKHFELIIVRFNYFYDSKHVLDMVAFKSPKREFKGLLIIVRESISMFTELIYSAQI